MNVTKTDETFYSVEFRVRRWMDLAEDGEVRVFGGVWHPEAEVKFTDVDDVQRYVDRVLAHIRCPRPITVRQRRGARFAHYEAGGVMAVPPRHLGGDWALREIVILHEITHHLVGCRCGHDGAFARAFVNLLSDTGHPVLARMLEIACWEGGQPLDPA